jgi:hypothetical protein
MRRWLNESCRWRGATGPQELLVIELPVALRELVGELLGDHELGYYAVARGKSAGDDAGNEF